MSLRALRHDWPVRWAHHPLCSRHAHETLRIGRLFLCRGCAALALGVASASLALPVVSAPASAWSLLGLLPVIAASWPPRYRRLPRIACDGLRFAAGALLVFALAATWYYPTLAWPVLPTLYFTWRGFVRRRAQLQLHSCEGCPELGRRGVCSGYARQAASLRAIEAELEARLGEALSGSGAPPRRLLRRD